MKVSSTVSPKAGTATATIRLTRCVAWAVVSCWPGLGRLRLPGLSRVRVIVAEMTAEIVMTTAARPRIALGLRRMEAKAPSRISLTPSGRSGITPGLGAASPYRGRWPARGGPYPCGPYPCWPVPLLPWAGRPVPSLPVAGLPVARLIPRGPAGRIRLAGSGRAVPGLVRPGLACRSLPRRGAARAIPAAGREPWLGPLGVPVPWRVRRRTVCHGSPSRHAAAELLADSRACPHVPAGAHTRTKRGRHEVQPAEPRGPGPGPRGSAGWAPVPFNLTPAGGQTQIMSVPTLQWLGPPGGPAVALLDQTRLPAEEKVVTCQNVPELVDAIRRLVIRGAPGAWGSWCVRRGAGRLAG